MLLSFVCYPDLLGLFPNDAKPNFLPHMFVKDIQFSKLELKCIFSKLLQHEALFSCSRNCTQILRAYFDEKLHSFEARSNSDCNMR